MYISIIGGVLNLVLDLTLVHGIEDFIPAMGVKGAAYASLIAQIVMFILAIYFLIKKTPFNLNPTLKFNPEFKTTLRLTANMLIRTLALNATFILALRFANGYGETVLSTYAVGINIWLFSSFFIDGYSNAGNAIAGKLLGQRDVANLAYLGNYLLKINLFIACLLAGSYLLLSTSIANLYFDNSVSKSIFHSFFWIIILAQPINSIAYSLDGIFKGLGEAKLLRNVLLLGTFCVFIPALYLFDYLNFGIIGIWFSFLAWMSWRAVSLYFIFKSYTQAKATELLK